MDIGNLIIKSTQEVFSTMVMLEVQPGAVVEGKGESLVSNVTAMIGLAGDLRGMLAVLCPEAAAKAITGSMLGMEVDELGEDVKDAVGEIANMVAGGLKSGLNDLGRKIELAIPTAVIGESFRMSGMLGANRIYIPFTGDACGFAIELKYVLE